MADQRLWAPWRMQYVQGERGDEGCIFCLAAEPGDDAARLVMHRGAGCFAMLNAFPYNSGHLMVSPDRHAASLADLDDDESLELMRLLRLRRSRPRPRRPALGGRQQLHGGDRGHPRATAIARGLLRGAADALRLK